MSNPTTGTDAAAPNALLENAGLDVIAESERKGRPRDLFMPWFAANISNPLALAPENTFAPLPAYITNRTFDYDFEHLPITPPHTDLV